MWSARELENQPGQSSSPAMSESATSRLDRWQAFRPANRPTDRPSDQPTGQRAINARGPIGRGLKCRTEHKIQPATCQSSSSSPQVVNSTW